MKNIIKTNMATEDFLSLDDFSISVKTINMISIDNIIRIHTNIRSEPYCAKINTSNLEELVSKNIMVNFVSKELEKRLKRKRIVEEKRKVVLEKVIKDFNYYQIEFKSAKDFLYVTYYGYLVAIHIKDIKKCVNIHKRKHNMFMFFSKTAYLSAIKQFRDEEEEIKFLRQEQNKFYR